MNFNTIQYLDDDLMLNENIGFIIDNMSRKDLNDDDIQSEIDDLMKCEIEALKDINVKVNDLVIYLKNNMVLNEYDIIQIADHLNITILLLENTTDLKQITHILFTLNTVQYILENKICHLEYKIYNIKKHLISQYYESFSIPVIKVEEHMNSIDEIRFKYIMIKDELNNLMNRIEKKKHNIMKMTLDRVHKIPILRRY